MSYADVPSAAVLMLWYNVPMKAEWIDYGDAQLIQHAKDLAARHKTAYYNISVIDNRIRSIREKYKEWKKNGDE